MHTLRLLPLLLLAGSLASQGLDTTQIRYRDALVTVRGAFVSVSAELQSIQRDIRTAADVTIQSKIGRLRAACRSAQSTLAAERPVFEAVRGSSRQTAAARQLVVAMRTLDRVLTEQCLDALTVPGAGIVADTIRAWMPYRARQIRDAEQAYHQAAATFARTVGVRIPPLDPQGR